jgi:hypothetical protein
MTPEGGFIETPLADVIAYIFQKMALSIDVSHAVTAERKADFGHRDSSTNPPARPRLRAHSPGCRRTLEGDKLVIVPSE